MLLNSTESPYKCDSSQLSENQNITVRIEYIITFSFIIYSAYLDVDKCYVVGNNILTSVYNIYNLVFYCILTKPVMCSNFKKCFSDIHYFKVWAHTYNISIKKICITILKNVCINTEKLTLIGWPIYVCVYWFPV